MGNTRRIDFFHMYYYLSRRLSFFELFWNEKRYISSCCSFIVEPNAGFKRHHSDSEETPEDATPLRNRVSGFWWFSTFCTGSKKVFFRWLSCLSVFKFVCFGFVYMARLERLLQRKQKRHPALLKMEATRRNQALNLAELLCPLTTPTWIIQHSLVRKLVRKLENSLTYKSFASLQVY